jgi:hypothetical protein
MRKPISPKLHGVLDYATTAVTALLPLLVPLPPRATRTAEAWAAGYTALSALTDYPTALRRRIPFRMHGAVDRTLGLVVPALPWILGFARDRRARNLFLALAGVTIVVTALTDWDSAEGAN